TWLAKSKPSLAQIAKIMFCWSYHLPQIFAASETDIIKASLPQYGTVKDLYDTYFLEYMWRRRFTQNNSDAFNKLVEHIALYSKNLENV
ncbi:9152_t:CDS:2, partial [Gigaspora margarita]